MIKTPIDAMIVTFLLVAALTWLYFLWRGNKSNAAKFYWSCIVLLVAFGEYYFGGRGETVSEITIAGQPLMLVMGVTFIAPLFFALHWWDLARRIKE